MSCRNFRSVCGWTLMLAGLSACSTITPYDSSFSCRSDDYGQCIHPEEAYEQAVALTEDGAAGATRSPVNRRQRGPRPEPIQIAAPVPTTYEGYQGAVYRELTGLVDAPVTPMLTPPRMVRTLILPYADKDADGMLFMPRYVYSIVEGPRFVMGDYLAEDRETEGGLVANGFFRAGTGEAQP